MFALEENCLLVRARAERSIGRPRPKTLTRQEQLPLFDIIAVHSFSEDSGLGRGFVAIRRRAIGGRRPVNRRRISRRTGVAPRFVTAIAITGRFEGVTGRFHGRRTASMITADVCAIAAGVAPHISTASTSCKRSQRRNQQDAQRESDDELARYHRMLTRNRTKPLL